MIVFIAKVVLFFYAKFNAFILFCKVEVIKSKCTIGEATVFLDGANVSNLINDKSRLCIGNETRIQGELIVHPNNGKIIIGEYCYVGVSSRIWSAKSIVIGNRVLISHGVNIHDFDSHPIDPLLRHLQEVKLFEKGHTGDLSNVKSSEIIISDDVWIGFGVTILKGVKIGKGSIIGCNTVVTHDVDDYSIVIGNPARTIRKICDSK
ncbi:acyltransferase [Marinomonas arenicola]|uniref:acyltransferase n=1 Tax=Marinomonas arenicola TaxID=569601 RepID=UPI00311D3775